ncbi:hypothetical protein [Yersinia phage fHe-Yen9-04]|uniref:Uncharacterized protein n=2 Tax=Eneladusvirus Yen904 TaxID=2560849 RepID=A0A2C9CY49_9CAUD|nr:membrane protein [Yersinia phage fHe-Yen9-04]SOK58765.1 hypothetical protein [Yersinia phage fHe-Yen9-04]SOK59300.1 hypothetical protein [Yersinia phage fHe-Yen9-03]VUE36534.1 hypothetical protein [Yersinia phage fHe-Yen9-04]
MKRSNINITILIIVMVEIFLSLIKVNDTYHFVNYSVTNKYIMLLSGTYVLFNIISSFMFFNISNDKKTMLHVYGYNKFSRLYTYHFLIFSFVMFHLESWEFCLMGISLFLMWNYERNKHSEYINKHNIEVLKEEAKHKPVVTLD